MEYADGRCDNESGTPDAEKRADILSKALRDSIGIVPQTAVLFSGTVEDSQNRYTALLSSLSEHLNIIEQNQRELNQKEPEEKIPANSQPFFETDADEEDEEDL